MTDQDHAELFIKRLITPADIAAKQQAGRHTALSEHQHKLGHYQRMMANRATNKKGGHQAARAIAGAMNLRDGVFEDVEEKRRGGPVNYRGSRGNVRPEQPKDFRIPKHRAQGINEAATINAEQATPIR